MLSIAKKAASRLRFTDIFNRAIGLTTLNPATPSIHAAAQHFPLSESTPSTHRNSRRVRSRRRRSPYVIDNPTGNVPKSRVLNNLRDQYRGATEVRTRVRRHNELRKERSFQRALRAEHGGSPAAREFHVLAGDVRQALGTSDVPKTHEDLIFERGLAELVGDFVAARKVVDVDFAKEVASTFDQIDEADFMAQLNEERARVELAMAAKEAEKKARREEREREREDRQRQKELDESRERRFREAEERSESMEKRFREAEERHNEAKRQADARFAAAELHRIAQEEHRVRLQEERRLRDQEHRARVEAERIACLERERAARLREEVRLARERENQRLRDEEQARAWVEAELRASEERTRQEANARAEQQAQWQREVDEYARRRLDEYVQSVLDPEMLEEANQKFQTQENRLRAQLEEAAARQAAAARDQWFYVQPEHYQEQDQSQDYWSDFTQDIPMRDPSNVDISMASVPPEQPQFILPTSDRDWFNLYESRWQELRDPNTDDLIFPSFPWPVFQFIGSFDQLDDTDIKTFFTSKYPGKLDKSWKVELTRWHPDKVERLKCRIRPDCVDFVRQGFLKCAKVMNAFQEEKQAERT